MKTVVMLVLVVASCCATTRADLGPPVDYTVTVINELQVPICGLYLWIPGQEGRTGMVATSPELNNWLSPGSYILADVHSEVLQSRSSRQLTVRARRTSGYLLRARACDESIVFESDDVDLEHGDIRLTR